MTQPPPFLAAVVAAIERPDESLARAARASRADQPGGRGRLDDLGGWLTSLHGSDPPPPPIRPRLLVIAGDHGVADAGVATRPAGSTAALVRATVAGNSPAARLAESLGIRTRVVAMSVDDDLSDLPATVSEHSVGRTPGQVHREPAMSSEQTAAALLAGIAVADDEVDSGTDLLVLTTVGRGAGVPAAALVGLLTKNDASLVTRSRGTIDDALWMRRCAAVRDAMRRGRPVLGDYAELLATTGGADIAAATGVLLQAAARRTPVVLDGTVTAAAALVAQRFAFRAVDWWAAGHRSSDRAQDLALERLSLNPLLDLGVRQEDGTGALLAVPVLQAAAAAWGID